MMGLRPGPTGGSTFHHLSGCVLIHPSSPRLSLASPFYSCLFDYCSNQVGVVRVLLVHCTSRSQGKAKVGSVSGMHPAASGSEARQCQSLLGSDSIMVILVGNSVRPSLPLPILVSYNLLGVTCPQWVRAIGPQKVKLIYPSRLRCLNVLFAKGGINYVACFVLCVSLNIVEMSSYIKM